jgi:hypothetical protein
VHFCGPPDKNELWGIAFKPRHFVAQWQQKPTEATEAKKTHSIFSMCKKRAFVDTYQKLKTIFVLIELFKTISFAQGK